ncbi:MAG: hypothetical protein Ct9H90mP28_4700 [Paracoccaceae bacterium]|nr:MAG: hypothetical protein Ct9H90mP28_4700 [Paracoccaceae bacterium]
MNLVYLASPIYIIGAILLFMVVVGMLYKLFCMNVKESFENEVEMAGVLDQIDDFDDEEEEDEEEEDEEEEDEEEEWADDEEEEWADDEEEEWADDEEEDEEEDEEDEDEEAVYCTQCGTRFPQGASFCAACGAER